jgi:outer membrane protein assembly factor BamB
VFCGRFLLLTALLAVLLSLAPGIKLNGSAQDVGTPAADSPSGGWTNVRGDAARRGVADAGPTGQPVEIWRVQADGPCGLPPAVVDGVVYAHCGDGVLRALDAATGTERWRFEGADLGDVTVAGDLVYVTDPGAIHALDIATGTERWQAEVADSFGAVVENGLLVLSTGDGFLLGLDAASGAERWRFQVTTQGSANSPALGGGTAYVGGEGVDFLAVDATSGELLWSGDIGEDQTGTAVVAEGIAYAGASGGSGEGRLHAFDAETGALLWRRDEPIFSPAVLDGVGYSGSAAGIVYAFDTATGAERWQVQLHGWVLPLSVAPGLVYAPIDDSRALYALDAATGQQLWRFDVDGLIDNSIAVDSGVAYVTTESGGIHAIGGRGEGATPAASPSSEMATPDAAETPEAAAAPAEFVWQTSGGPDGIETFYVAVAPDGTVWANDAGKGRFQLFDSDGQFLETWAPDGVPSDSALFVAFGPDGDIYVADGRFIHKYGPDRQPIVSWGGEGTSDGQFLNTTGIGIDAAGNVYVCDELRNDVQKFDADGRFLAKWGGAGTGEGQFQGAGFMDVDAEGNSYVIDLDGVRIHIFAADGTFLRSLAGEELVSPNDVAIDADGNIYVGEAGRGEIKVFDATGQFLTSFGEFGTGEGQLLDSGAVALDGLGGVYVADNAGSRIVKFHLTSPLAPEQ